MTDFIPYAPLVFLFVMMLAVLDRIFGIRRQMAESRRPVMTAQDVANRLHRIVDEGMDSIKWARLDLDDFVLVHTADRWRIGILLKNGDLYAVVNSFSREHKEPEGKGERQPLAVFREQWPDEWQKLQDVIVAALKRDGSI